MNRPLALCLSVLLGCATLSTTGFAAEVGALTFRIAADQSGAPRLSLRSAGDRDRMDGDFRWAEIKGFDQARLRATAGQPVRFAVVREAGRIDCAGTSRGDHAEGGCKFTADPAFANLLAARGIERPDEREAFALTMTGATRALVKALAAARYPTPTLDDLMGMAAVGVSPAYIGDLAAHGYRPKDLSHLIAFKALDVTPAYVDELRRFGFAQLTGEEIVQFKALDISPAYARSLRNAGYPDISAEDIVQLRALGVTADYIRSMQPAGLPRLSIDQLVQCKALGVTPGELRAAQGKRLSWSSDDLVAMKVAGLLP
ncbi:hypothetical protein GCM10022281_00990 [Sphingomonas rosea]|uniref:Uncharacterized protein n=1 Tax=Sphingomonas rosea TaxID=335605 RepID=A0ABP7TGX1_9SPHN